MITAKKQNNILINGIVDLGGSFVVSRLILILVDIDEDDD